jgi:hypothetical protein
MAKAKHVDNDEDELKKAIDDANMLVAVALIRERYGVMRREVNELNEYVEAAKAEKTWYKGYAAATIAICTFVVTGVTWAANNHVIQKVNELVNQNRPPQVSTAAPGRH